MGAKGHIGLAVAGLLAALLSACGSGGSGGGSGDSDIAQVEVQSDESDVQLPARYGLYVLQDGQLGRLDGEKSFQVETWESRSSLASNVRFIVFDRALGDRSLRLEDAIKLRRVAHVRSDVAASGAATPLQKDTWVVADLAPFAVPVDFRPMHGSPEMVEVIPFRPLPPGLYSLQFRAGDSAVAGRFGVKWSKIDKAQYASANCVDRYPGSPPSYRLCSDQSAQFPQQQITQQPLTRQPLQQHSLQQQPLQAQGVPQPNTFQYQLVQPYRTPPAVPDAPEPPVANQQPQQAAPKQQPLQQQATREQPPEQPPGLTPSAQGLKLRDVKAARTVDQGVAILTVEGVVMNSTKEPRRVPALLATVRDLKGTDLDHWTFAVENPDLPPGGSTGFRTETIYPTNQSTNVAVTFASDSTAQAQ
ncbi:MAG TPA: hypothetical protein VLV76_23280 [Candidatus Acidoferrum sp.]|nr:hypothetical protein [Candidatus Acidoferrum sp.]